MNGNDEFKKSEYNNQSIDILNNKIQEKDIYNIDKDYNIDSNSYDEKRHDSVYDYLDVEELEVLADGVHRWLSFDNMLKICRQITPFELDVYGIKFNPEKKDISHIAVSDEFLNYVKEKTRMPKYIPILVEFNQKYRDNFEIKKDDNGMIVLVQRVNGTLEEQIEYGGKTR